MRLIPGALSDSHSLKDRRDALAQADTHRGKAKLGVTAFHQVNQRGADTCAGAAKRVAERYRAAVKVDLLVDLLHQAQIFNAGQDLRGKGFVHLKQIDIARGQTGFFQR